MYILKILSAIKKIAIKKLKDLQKTIIGKLELLKERAII